MIYKRNPLLMIRLFISSVLILLAWPGITQTAIPSAEVDTQHFEPCAIENLTFQSGEELTYRIYYQLSALWLAAGEVTFRVEQIGDEYRMTAYGRSLKSYEWAFKVRDYYETYVNQETLLPIRSVRDINEGNYSMYERLRFDQINKKAVCERGSDEQEIKDINHYALSNCMHDMLSLFYSVRNIDFTQVNKGEIIPVKLFMDQEEWPLRVEYQGVENNVRVKGLGRHDCLVLSPEVIAGYVFEEDTRLKVYASNDGNKVPLMIESPINVGSIKAVLKSHKGLKYPLE